MVTSLVKENCADWSVQRQKIPTALLLLNLFGSSSIRQNDAAYLMALPLRGRRPFTKSHFCDGVLVVLSFLWLR